MVRKLEAYYKISSVV